MAVFAELPKIRGRTVFGRFNMSTRESERNSKLIGEGQAVLDIVDAHENQHSKDYRISGVNCVYDTNFEARAHLAALRRASSYGGVHNLQANTKMGAEVIEDLQAINAGYSRQSENCQLPVTYEPNMNNLCFMTNALWDLRKRSERSEMKSKLKKIFLGTTVLAIAIIYVALGGAITNPESQNQTVTPFQPSPLPSSSLTYTPTAPGQINQTPRASFTKTPTISNQCLTVTGNLDQTISVWKTRYPGKESYYYGQVNKVGEKGFPCP